MSTISAIAESNAETSFEKLMSLSMIQEPPQGINLPGSGINFCQINGFFHEYIMSQPKEDNMVFALGGGLIKASSTQGDTLPSGATGTDQNCLRLSTSRGYDL